MDENIMFSLPAVALEGMLTESTPLEQQNYFYLLHSVKDILPLGILETIRNVLPRVYTYDSLKIAFSILIGRKLIGDKLQFSAMIQATEDAWPGCPDRLKLCAAVRRRIKEY